jgi:hypothetical protein
MISIIELIIEYIFIISLFRDTNIGSIYLKYSETENNLIAQNPKRHSFSDGAIRVHDLSIGAKCTTNNVLKVALVSKVRSNRVYVSVSACGQCLSSQKKKSDIKLLMGEFGK